MPSPTLTVRHYATAADLTSNTGTTFTADSNRGFKAILSDEGAGSFTLANTDPNRAAVALGDYVQFILDDTAMFLSVVDSIDRILVDDNEEAGQVTKYGCRGVIAEWAKAKVQPSTPIGSKLWARDRMFGWMSPELDISGMSAAVIGWQQKSSPYDAKIGMPLGWFDPDGYWIWSNAGTGTPPVHAAGTSYFWSDWNLAADTTVAIHAAADDAFAYYIDGVAAAASGDVNGWHRAFRTIIELPAGIHRIAIKAENYDRAAATNVAGVIGGIYALDTSGKEDLLMVRTNSAHWVCADYPAVPPGVTVGTVLSTLLSEAQADGALTGWTLSFDGTNDSHGVAWPVDEQFSFPVGSDLLSALKQLAETHIDFTFDADSRTLNAYKIGTAGSSTSVANLTTGIAVHEVRERDTAVDGLLVLYKDGYTEVGTAGRQEFLALGSVSELAEVTDVASAELSRLSTDLSDIRLEPDPTAAVFQTSTTYNSGSYNDGVYDGGAAGGIVYTLGDTVTIPAVGGGTETQRVRAVEVVDDGNDGQVKVTPELADRLDPVEIRTARAIRRMIDGSINGRSLSASLPQISSGVKSERVQLETEEFGWNATGTATLLDAIDVELNPIHFDVDGRIAWIEYSWNTPPAVDATVVGKANGTVLFTHTLPASTKEHQEFPNVAISRTSDFTMTLTSVDAVAEGLTAKVRQAVFIG